LEKSEDKESRTIDITDFLDTDDVKKKYILEIIQDELFDRTIGKMDIDKEDNLDDIREAISLYLEAKIKEYSAYSLLLKSGSNLGLKILISRLKKGK